MNLYRCVWYDDTALQPGFRPIHADTDAQARKIAFTLLRENSRIDRVEVWRGSDLAFRLNRRQALIESAT